MVRKYYVIVFQKNNAEVRIKIHVAGPHIHSIYMYICM
jgi:hypothetical protein